MESVWNDVFNGVKRFEFRCLVVEKSIGMGWSAGVGVRRDANTFINFIRCTKSLGD